jgi:hypothetical protein
MYLGNLREDGLIQYDLVFGKEDCGWRSATTQAQAG